MHCPINSAKNWVLSQNSDGNVSVVDKAVKLHRVAEYPENRFKGRRRNLVGKPRVFITVASRQITSDGKSGLGDHNGVIRKIIIEGLYLCCRPKCIKSCYKLAKLSAKTNDIFGAHCRPTCIIIFTGTTFIL